MQIFIGWDRSEIAAYQVCSYSIIKNASKPVTISPLNIRHLDWFTNNDNKSTTEFAFTRFLVPFLSDYKGVSLFMDSDMLVRTDIHRIMDFFDPEKAVQVVKHDYNPNMKEKFSGNKQTTYYQKNWSSVMLFNNKLCKNLVPEYVNSTKGLNLHQFKWVDESLVGELPRSWNYLVGEEMEKQPDADIVHFTRGGPYFKEYDHCEYANEWFKYWREANSVLDRRVVNV